MCCDCNCMYIVVIAQGCLCLYRKFERNQSSSTLLIFKLTVLADVGEVSVLSSHHQLRLRFKDKNRSSLSSVQTQRKYRLGLLSSDPNIHSKAQLPMPQHCHSHSKISPVAGV